MNKWLQCIFVLIGVLHSSWVFPDSNLVIVLANKNIPSSLELADYYMAARDLSSNQLCVLDLPITEEMTRSEYENRLRDPLLKFLRDKKWIRQKRIKSKDL